MLGELNPIAFAVGPVKVRWYSLAYIVGILGGWWLMSLLSKRAKSVFSPRLISDFIPWVIVGIIVGARLGYVVFYNPAYYLANPLQAFAVWHGGMSFHGGLCGVALAAVLFSRLKSVPLLAMGDLLAVVAPLGLMLGRVANFINGELYGKVAYDLPWAVEFARGGGFPRHPSQLYEAALEGLLPLIVFIGLWGLVPFISRHKGLMTGVFLVWYAVARSVVELVREPDAQLGYFFGASVTMGQMLSLPLALAGAGIIFYALKNERKKRKEKEK